jgi:hypothetical protein
VTDDGRPGQRVVGAIALGGAGVVVGLFLITLAHLVPPPDAGVVVVADPAVAPGQPLPVRVLGVGRRGRLAFRGQVAGAAVDGRGLAMPSRPPIAEPLRVAGVLVGADGEVVTTVDDSFPLAPRAVDAGVVVIPWSRALALPAVGAAVHPERGLVPGRGSSRVVLVDDAGVDVVEVDAGRGARLPDGRLLLLDREPLAVQLVELAPAAGGDVVVEVAGVDDDDVLAVELIVAGVVRAMRDVVGPGVHRVALPADAAVGDLVVVRVAASPLPSANGRVVVTRVGGPRPADLLVVEPRLAGHRWHDATRAGRPLDDDTVTRAMLARLAPRLLQAPVVSSSLHAQAVRRLRAQESTAAQWRQRLRIAAVGLVLLVVVAAARAARRTPAAAAGAIVVVVALVAALDLVIAAAAPDAADAASVVPVLPGGAGSSGPQGPPASR